MRFSLLFPVRHQNYREECLAKTDGIRFVEQMESRLLDSETIQAIEKMVQLRQISTAEFILQWDASSSKKEQGELASNLSMKLSSSCPKAQGALFAPPSGIVHTGKNGKAQIIPGRLQANASFSGNYSSDWGLARKYIEKHWGRLISVFESCSFEPDFIALVTNVKMSNAGIGIDCGRTLARHFNVPGWQHDICDADFRVATSLKDRYYLNVGLATYAALDVAIVATGDKDKPLSANKPETSDTGLRLKVDANTKYNITKGTGPIVVTDDDFRECLNLITEFLDSGLSRFLLE